MTGSKLGWHLAAARPTVLLAALWVLLALAILGFRESADAALILWAPAGVAVAAFQISPRARWPLVAAILLPVQTIAVIATGLDPLLAAAFCVSGIVKAVIAAHIGLKVLGGSDRIPSRFSQVLGLFFAALAGSLAGTILAAPFQSPLDIGAVAWWFFANVLGILTVAPLITLVREWHGRGLPFASALPPRACIASLAIFVLLSCATLLVGTVALLPVLVGALVLIAVRYGQNCSTLSVVLFGVVATIVSIGSGSPVPALSWKIAEATLLVQGWMLVMLAAALPIAAMLLKRDELQYELIRRNNRMYESLMMLDLAEQMTGIGRWRLDMVTGEQDWSNRMLDMHGLPPDTLPDLEEIGLLLPDRGDILFGEIERNAEARDPYTFDYRIKPERGTERIVRMSILNEFDMTGARIALFGVAIDVTEQVRREEALDLARGRALRLAQEAQKQANTDPLTNLPNRRCTFARLESMVEVAAKRGSALTAIMFDIDHFKAINDTHGHQTGDEVIVQVAELGRRQARHGDLVGRIGGEEFVWLVPGLEIAAARRLAERLRISVESGIEGSALPNVTISVGMAQFASGDSGDALLARADAALYEAKDAGRNRVRRAA